MGFLDIGKFNFGFGVSDGGLFEELLFGTSIGERISWIYHFAAAPAAGA